MPQKSAKIAKLSNLAFMIASFSDKLQPSANTGLELAVCFTLIASVYSFRPKYKRKDMYGRCA